ncbi:MAG: hypothetical protein M5R41_13415 [Bacteroidia bacterium]|nr:hypothetical protein [Bacteroidia bacterium]
MRFIRYSLIILCLWIMQVAAQPIIVDHTSVALFDSIPPQYKAAAENLRMLFMDRSVGGNIHDALSCLSFPHASAPNFCKRYQHRDSAYAVDPSEVYWNGTWNRSRWRYEFWPSGCSEDANCFVNFVEPRIDSFDVVGFQFSYLAVMPGTNLIHPVDGFFGSRTDRGTATSYKDFAARHPEKTIIWWTTSLARGIGSPESQTFNDAMRQYARTHDLVLFDVADILSHDPSGNPCYDNRDGVQYLTENNPDDGLNIPAICPQYTTETEGGHLGSISAGGIRVAKAFWVLMARIAGWQGGGSTDTNRIPPAPVLLAPANNAMLADSVVQFTWRRSIPTVSRYRIDVATDAGFTGMLHSDTTLADTTVTLSALPRGRTLYWRVGARSDMGWSAPSVLRSFRIEDGQLFSALPLTEMGASLYKGFAGGLYPGALNQRPAAHNAAGLALANSITPLDTLGLPDPANGKIVLLSVGMSNTGQEFSVFEATADTFQLRNPKVEVVNGAQAGQTASIIRDPDAQFWSVLERERLYSHRVKPAQVQVVWLKQANIAPSEAFPIHAEKLQADIQAVLRLLPIKFPNIKLCYLSSRTYGGYATTQLNPEPYAYESGFTVKWLIERQIDGDTALSFESTTRRAPWLSWGPYLWASGPEPRQDGLVWLPVDVASDGTHPSDAGRRKVADLLLRFFSTDETSVPWFLKPQSTGIDAASPPESLTILAAPNPARDLTTVQLRAGSDEHVRVELYSLLGSRITLLHDGRVSAGSLSMNISARALGLSAGSYVLRASTSREVRSVVLMILP